MSLLQGATYGPFQAAYRKPTMMNMTRRTWLGMRGNRTSGGAAKMRGSSARKNGNPCRTAMPRSNRKAPI